LDRHARPHQAGNDSVIVKEVMFTPQQQTPSPDWETLKTNLNCPLCDYNLRGLTEPRCPECGFTFEWRELLDTERDRHPYLFEHQPKHNIWSFWKTFWTDCRPRRFWLELNPANAVRIKRLLIYWILANSILLLATINPFIKSGMRVIQSNAQWSQLYTPVPGGQYYRYRYFHRSGLSTTPMYGQISAAQYHRFAPDLWTWEGVKTIVTGSFDRYSIFLSLVVILAWPWMTLLSLLVFQASMRRARIKTGHVLRCAIYSCDFGLLLAAILLILSFDSAGQRWSDTYLLLMICPILALYRLTFAYKRYLRFSHPFFTVLASQVMVFLATFIVLLNWTHWW
jgi:hypothetical protein